MNWICEAPLERGYKKMKRNMVRKDTGEFAGSKIIIEKVNDRPM